MIPCPECGDSMRKSNTRGACSKCIDGVTDPVDRQFRDVCKALGFDRETVLRGFKKQFLDDIRRKAAK